MNVIVIGGGKVGFYLCKTLLEHGHQPLIIEKNKRTCEYASTQLDIPTINADGSTIEALTAANASRSDAVIAVTGLDQDNLISCQLAKEIFHVSKTVARVNNPKNAAVMKKLGVDIPISSTDNIARLLEREVDTARIKALLSLNRGDPRRQAHHSPRQRADYERGQGSGNRQRPRPARAFHRPQAHPLTAG